MEDKIIKTKESPAVLAHIEMMQGIINRLSEKSANCKNWCVGLITAIFLLLFSSETFVVQKDLSWMYYIPIFLFLFLNCYYLGQERIFIKQERDFVNSINEDKLDVKEIFYGKGAHKEESWCWRLIKKFWGDLCNTIGALFSFSVIIFYSASFVIMKMTLCHLLDK